MNYSKSNQEMQTGWDAREGYVRELVYRGHLVLDADDNNPKKWFERLSDFFDWASCSLDTDYTSDLKEIDYLLYATKVTKNSSTTIFTESERRIRKKQSYDKMREVFRKIQKELFIKGMYVPLNAKQDPNRAIANMSDSL